MTQPAGVVDVFTALVIAVGAYCLARLVAALPLGRRSHYDVNAGHVLMAVAMVGMLVPAWQLLASGVWEVVFGALAAWFAVVAIRTVAAGGTGVLAGAAGRHIRHYAVHAVMSAAMVYMLGLDRPGTGGTLTMGRAGAGVPVVTFGFLLVLLGSVVWQLDGIGRFRSLAVAGSPAASPGAVPDPASGGGRPWLAPRIEVGCHIAMCLAMAYMLVLVV